jgi:hypothetical protein
MVGEYIDYILKKVSKKVSKSNKRGKLKKKR